MIGLNNSIPFNGLNRQYDTLKYEIRERTDSILASGQALNGPYIYMFEQAIAERVGRKYAIAVNSCTNGLHYIFDYLKTRDLNYDTINNTPNIATSNFSFKATTNVIANRGNAHLLDVNAKSGLIDFKKLSELPHMDILMYVNLYGNMVDYEELMMMTQLFTANDDTFIIEDAAQSFGSLYKGKPSGSFGHASVLSFDPTKNLPNYGSGGMILTDDVYMADFLREYVTNNKTFAWDNAVISDPWSAVNSRMSEVDCASMLIKLKYFDKWQARRTEIANYYNENLPYNVITPDSVLTPGTIPNWHKYVISVNERNELAQRLAALGIETKVHYHETLEKTHYSAGAHYMSNHVLSLPIFPELTDTEVERVVDAVTKSMF